MIPPAVHFNLDGLIPSNRITRNAVTRMAREMHTELFSYLFEMVCVGGAVKTYGMTLVATAFKNSDFFSHYFDVPTSFFASHSCVKLKTRVYVHAALQ